MDKQRRARWMDGLMDKQRRAKWMNKQIHM